MEGEEDAAEEDVRHGPLEAGVVVLMCQERGFVVFEKGADLAVVAGDLAVCEGYLG